MYALLFLAPLPIWALNAHGSRWGRTLGVLLVVLVAVELAVAWHLIFSAARITLLVSLPVATAVVVLAGLAVGGGDAAPSRRRNAWRALSAAYSAMAIVGALVAFLVVLDGYPTKPPPVSEIGPLPAGLYVAHDTSSCSTGSGDFCDRYLVIASGGHASSAAVLDELRTSLTACGWTLAPDGHGGWTAGKSEGVLLDVHDEDVDVSVVGGRVTVDLEEGVDEY